jgi:hypothetical protein
LVDQITAEEEEEQNVEGRSYGQTENEIENYELEQQNQDPYKIGSVSPDRIVSVSAHLVQKFIGTI